MHATLLDGDGDETSSSISSATGIDFVEGEAEMVEHYPVKPISLYSPYDEGSRDTTEQKKRLGAIH